MRPAIRRPGSRGFLSAGTAVVLLVSSVAMVTGTGFKFGETKLRDGVTWIFNREDGEVARVNGSSGKVDLTIALPGSSGKDLEIVQRDNAVLVLDRETGEVASLDVNGLKVANRTDFGTADDLDVVLGDDAAYIVDRVSGTVQRVDPTDLRRIGPPLPAGKGLSEGVADAAGRLWVAQGATGEIIRLDPDGSDGLVEQVRRKLADPGAQLEITLVDDGIVVTDAVSGTQWRLDADGNDIGSYEIELPPDLPDDRITPPVSSGPYVPVTVGDEDEPAVVIPPSEPGGGGPPRRPVPLDPPVDDFQLPAPAVTLGDRMYVPVLTEGIIVVLDLDGRYLETISVPGEGEFQLILDDGRLWANDPDDPTALRIDEDGTVTEVEKAAEEVPSTPPTTKPEKPEEPEDPEDPETPTPPDPGGNDPTPPTTTAPPATTTTTTAPPPTTPPTAPPATSVPATTVPPPTTEPVPDPEPPAAPTALVVTPASRALALSWTSGDDGGAAVTRHLLAWTPRGGCGAAGETESGPEATATIEGLVNGCTYDVTVVARNAAGRGPAAAGSGMPSANRPDAPAAPTARMDPGTGSTEVAWQQPDLQGLPSAGYTLQATSRNGEHAWTQNVPAGQTAVVIPGAEGDQQGALAYGRNYTFTVAAITASQGDFSPPSAEVSPYTGAAGISITEKVRTGPQQWRYTVQANWRGQVGTIQAAGAAQGQQPGDGPRTFDVTIPWGSSGSSVFQACVPNAPCAETQPDSQGNPLPRFTGNLDPRWGPCVLNPDAGNGVAANDQVYENASWAAPVDFGGEGARQYVGDIQYSWEYAYGPGQASPDVSNVTYGGNPGSGQLGDGEVVIPSRRHEDAYTWFVGIRFRVQGHDGWIETSVRVNSPNCPGDD